MKFVIVIGLSFALTGAWVLSVSGHPGRPPLAATTHLIASAR